MYTKPMMFPLDLNGDLYLVQDENGNTIGTGSRKVCEVLVHLIRKPIAASSEASAFQVPPQRANVRSAITV